MKKNFEISLLLIVLMLLSTVVRAQTEKEGFILSGSTNLNFVSLSQKIENNNTSIQGSKASNFEISSGAGYFIFNNFAIGVQISIKNATEDVENQDATESSTMFIPFALLYFGNGNIKPYVQAGLGSGSKKLKNHSVRNRANVTGYELAGGLAVFLSQKVSLDFSLSYASATSKFSNVNDWELKSKGIGGNIGLSLFF